MARPRRGPCGRGAIMLGAGIALVLSTFGNVGGATPRVRAEASRDLPSPAALALPASLFPAGATIHGRRASVRTLQAASGLHLISLNEQGHLEGYLESIRWPVSVQGATSRQAVTLRYMVSIFASAAQADAAYGDAQASLWEIGHPLRGKVANSHPFAVAERDGHGDAYLLLYRGPIELELRLRYGPTLGRPSVRSALWYLQHAGIAAWRRVGTLAGTLPLSSSSQPANALPDIYAAPWGAGPVVKSPSLMVLDASQVGPGTHLHPGEFRYSGPPLASRAVRHADLLAQGALARYVRTGTVDGGQGWYDEAALYDSPPSAAAALLGLAHHNRYHSWLPPYPLYPGFWHVGGLSVIDNSRAWTQQGETIFVFQVENVLLVLADVGWSADEMAPLVQALVASVPTWLHAQGTTIETAGGVPVRLQSANWYGAEEEDFVPGGLDIQTYQEILQQVKLLGFNALRIPFSNQMVEENPVVTTHLAANPELVGKHALDILDQIIGYAGALGISVILDDHRSTAGWGTQPDGLWYAPGYPDSSWIRDWVLLAQRYAGNNVVIGADLRNEPHAKVSWGDGNALTDWHAAAQRGGDAVLAANPHLLIIVEGIQYYKNAASYWWGGSLQGVADDPVVLTFADGTSARSQLVYSVHDYGPDNCGRGCPWFNKTTTFDGLAQTWEQYWGFVVDDPNTPFAAPIWVGEFGTCDYQLSCVEGTEPGSQGQWFSSLVRFIAEKHVSWGYWAVNGTESTGGTRVYGTLDWYGLLDHTWSQPYPWLHEGLAGIMGNPGPTSS